MTQCTIIPIKCCPVDWRTSFLSSTNAMLRHQSSIYWWCTVKLGYMLVYTLLTKSFFQINLLAIQMEQTKPSYKFGGLFAFDKQFLFSVLFLLLITKQICESVTGRDYIFYISGVGHHRFVSNHSYSIRYSSCRFEDSRPKFIWTLPEAILRTSYDFSKWTKNNWYALLYNVAYKMLSEIRYWLFIFLL